MRTYTALSISLSGMFVGQITAKSCQDYKIPVTITTENQIFGLPPFEDDFDVADYIDNISSRSASPDPPFSGSVNETACYEISATFCTPGRGEPSSHKSTVLIATHGLNFDRSYWHPQIEEETYSFVDFVTDRGYSILYYDRLGVGKSSQVSGYKAQLSQQTAILQKIVHSVKTGNYVKDIGVPDKVVLVGHSFGSSISITALGVEPTLADGVILTGFSLNATYINTVDFVQAGQPRIAAKQHPGKWRQLDTGYITPVDLYANVNTFFKKPDYDVKVARYADANKQPFAVMETLTAGSLILPFTFTGATMIITGEFDFIFCESDCNGGILETPAAGVFSQAKDFKAISYPGAGHGLNFHLNATGAYSDIVDFLGTNDL